MPAERQILCTTSSYCKTHRQPSDRQVKISKIIYTRHNWRHKQAIWSTNDIYASKEIEKICSSTTERKSERIICKAAKLILYADFYKSYVSVVIVDGTFLKSTYRGTLLIASTQDPTGSILPLAYAIVDSENNASWEWFFARFKDAFGENEGMYIVSDRHEGIDNATATLYRQVPHCICIWHLWNNVKKNYKKNHLQLKDIFFTIAKAYIVEQFDYHMADIEIIDKRVKDYLINIGYERWSRAYSTINRTLTMTSNIAESINAALKAARELQVLPFLEYIGQLVRLWNVTNQKNAIESFTDLGKKYDTMLMDNLELSHRMKV
ncbi:protein FAR-RED ELONGATED HYPOCOTYL 3-like [Nicotiana tomentosiformis]|uniref:protein FAR-RED ELONGATED HYPOCOTYL 3-like n=1 Tax=Nicotiana tomentosiformis TaxID=4098 RepID=UPI00388C9B3D